MKKFRYRPTPLADHVRRLVGYGVDEIDTFLQHVRDHGRIQEHRIERLAATVRDDDDRFVDERAELLKTHEMASQFAVIALHRIVEHERSWLLQYGVPRSGREDLHRFDVATKHAATTLGVDLSKIPGARAVDEIRWLNNAVKHNGIVTPQLAKFGRWKVDAELHDVTRAYERLRAAVSLNIVALARHAERAHKRRQHSLRQVPPLKPSTR